MLQMASAGTVAVGADGNLTVTSDYQTVAEPDLADTNNTIRATGGSTTPNTITVNAGAVLTGDAAYLSAVSVEIAGYSLVNAGSLSGQEYGVDSPANNVNVTNSGTIQGVTLDGIYAGGGSVISNSNGILGGTNGINFHTAGGTVNNSGSIAGGSGSGILAISGLSLSNSGAISGATGVSVTGGGSTLSVTSGGTITGTGGTAVQLGNDGNTLNLTNGRINGDVIAGGTSNVVNVGTGLIDGNVNGFGAINVATNGRLSLYGDVNGPGTVITAATGSMIRGEGLWTANVNLAQGAGIEASALSGSAPDLLRIAGNVTHSAGSSIVVEADPDRAIANDGTEHSVIRSTSGTYDARNATIQLKSTGPEALRNGNRVIVDAAGGTVLGGGNTVVYRGNTASVLGNYFSSVALSGGDLVQTTNHNFSDLPGLSTNQGALGEALDQFMIDESALASGLTANQALRNLIGDLDYNNLDYTQSILAGIIAPAEQVLGATGSVVNSNYRLHRMAQDHLANARNGGERTVTTTTPATRDAKGGMIEGTTTTETVGSGKGNLWGTYSYDEQDFESTDFDGEIDALTVGFDYQVAPGLILGLLIDGSKGDLNHAAGDSEVESLRAAIYGSWGESTGLYIDFLAGYGDHDLDFTDATSFQGLGTIGYTMESGCLKHGPFAGLEYQKVDVDGFDSDAVFPVEYDDYDVESFRGLLGYRLSGTAGRFSPYLSVAYAHEFTDERYRTTGAISGYEFPVEGYEPGSAVLITAGTGVSLTDALTLNIGYRGEIALDDEGVESHGGSLGLNYRF